MATEIKPVSGTIELKPVSNNGNGTSPNGKHPERIVLEGPFESELMAEDGAFKNVMIAAGHYLVGAPAKRDYWEGQLRYWARELNKTEPHLAEAFMSRFQHQRMYIRYFNG